MKYHLYSLIALLSGCTTSATTGSKKLLGLIPVPGTRDPSPTKLQLLVEQLEKFTWVGIILVVAGAVWWKITDGFTGLGKLLFGIGWSFIGLALLLPQIVAYLVVTTGILLVLAVGFVVWTKLIRRGK